MIKEIELIKRDQIDDLNQTIKVCQHLMTFEMLSISSRDLLTQRIENCQLKITGLKEDLKDTLPDLIYNICNPGRSVSNV